MVTIDPDTQEPFLSCLQCQRHTHHPHDIAEKFCPACGYLEDNHHSYAVFVPVPPDLKSVFKSWSVCEGPSDFPAGYYVARVHYCTSKGPEPGDSLIASTNLELIRQVFRCYGLTRMNRFNNDDPVILETWI